MVGLLLGFERVHSGYWDLSLEFLLRRSSGFGRSFKEILAAGFGAQGPMGVNPNSTGRCNCRSRAVAESPYKTGLGVNSTF